MSDKCWIIQHQHPDRDKIKVVLPACNRDIDLMLHNLRWQRDLDVRKDYGCVLSLDGSLTDSQVCELESNAWDTFSWVDTLIYPTAPNPSWPQAPNWAFQHTAHYMKGLNSPWFWMEPDCIPLQPEWLDMLNTQYYQCRKPMMGVLVPGMGHCNGTAIYPHNFCDLSKRAMLCVDVAWDGEMKHETVHLTCNAPHLICHVWGIKGGKAQPFGGEPAVFNTWKDVVKWVDLNAAVFHRAKNYTLIDRLREKLV